MHEEIYDILEEVYQILKKVYQAFKSSLRKYMKFLRGLGDRHLHLTKISAEGTPISF